LLLGCFRWAETRQADADGDEWPKFFAGWNKVVRAINQKLMNKQIELTFHQTFVGSQEIDGLDDAKVIRPEAVGCLSGPVVGQINTKAEAKFAAFLEFALKGAAWSASEREIPVAIYERAGHKHTHARVGILSHHRICAQHQRYCRQRDLNHRVYPPEVCLLRWTSVKVY